MSTINFRMVRLARDFRRMSQTALAREAGIPQAALSRIEGNIRPPTAEQVEGLVTALRVPVEFLMEPDTPAAAPLFRKRAIRSAAVLRYIQARINTAVLAARRILDAGVDIDTPFSFPAVGDIARDDPVEASRILRRAWRLPTGRVDSVTNVIENAGGIVLHADFGTDDASAAFVSSVGDPRPWFLVNTRETSGDRVRLSLAHELGHAAMHVHLPANDEMALEAEAYRFALALLLPPEEFDRSVAPDLTLRRARDLKRAYWVSVQAIVKAADDRGLVTAERSLSLHKQISARGWRRDEPDHIPVEPAIVWPAALDVHREQHGFTNDEFAQVARLTPHDLSSLFPHDFAPRLRLVEPPHSVRAGRTPTAPARRFSA
jgi:Zn-dependent peptidase ImmA (M78 family)/transcriptional regulator with XRE-family HTH domain